MPKQKNKVNNATINNSPSDLELFSSLNNSKLFTRLVMIMLNIG